MHHDYDDSRRDKRFRLKIRHIILAVFAALMLAAVLHMVLLGTRANRRLMALRAAGHPTTLAELALRNKLSMGMDNAAPVYESAFAAFVPPADVNVPYVGKTTESSDRGAAWLEPTDKAVADCLAANEKCLALLHEAAGIENCRYDYNYGQGYPQLSKLRSCVLLLKLAAISHAHKGDADAAVACVKDGLCLGNSLQKEPFTLPYLVHIACIGAMITGMERTLSATTFTDAQLRDLGDALAAAGERVDLAQTLISERCLLIECTRDPSLNGMTGPGAVILKLPGIQSRGLNDILDHMEASIEAAGLPSPQRTARFREIEDRLRGLSMLHVMAQILAPAVARTAELDSRFQAHLNLARTALAIERYRLAAEKTPEQLDDLVPKYLEQVPIDPFDGRPIRYRRTEPGYVLYSIMEDRQDNGGKEKEQVGKGEPYDQCFIVAR